MVAAEAAESDPRKLRPYSMRTISSALDKREAEIPRFSPPTIKRIGFLKSASYIETESRMPAATILYPSERMMLIASSGSARKTSASSEVPAEDFPYENKVIPELFKEIKL